MTELLRMLNRLNKSRIQEIARSYALTGWQALTKKSLVEFVSQNIESKLLQREIRRVSPIPKGKQIRWQTIPIVFPDVEEALVVPVEEEGEPTVRDLRSIQFISPDAPPSKEFMVHFEEEEMPSREVVLPPKPLEEEEEEPLLDGIEIQSSHPGLRRGILQKVLFCDENNCALQYTASQTNLTFQPLPPTIAETILYTTLEDIVERAQDIVQIRIVYVLPKTGDMYEFETEAFVLVEG